MKLLKRILFFLLLILLLAAGTIFVSFTFYKKELTNLLIKEVRINYGLNLQMEKVTISLFENWPHTSINLKNVSISSDLSQRKNEVFLKAGLFAISFNLKKLFRKEFIIKYVALKDVEFNLIKYADGTLNFKIKKSNDLESKPKNLSLNLDKITLKNVKFNFTNEIRGQKIGLYFSDDIIRLKNYQEGIGFRMEGNVLIKGLLLNPEAGELLTNTRTSLNLIGNYFFKEKSICILPPSYTEIDGQRYNLSSIIDLSERKKLSIIIESKGVKSERVATYLSPKIKKVLSNFKVLRPLDAKVIIIARLGRKENAIIIADIIGRNCDLTIGESKVPYSKLYFKGRVLSLHQSRTKGDMEHAKIVFNTIKGNLYDFPFTASLSVTNLPKPIIDLQASLVIEGKSIKQDISKKFSIKGTALATIRYSGNARHLNKEQFLSDSMSLNAYLLFNNLNYKQKGANTDYTLNGKAILNKQSLNFEKLQLQSPIGDLILKGKVNRFLQFVLSRTQELQAEVEASSAFLNLNPLLRTESEVKQKETKRKKGSTFFQDNNYKFKIDLNAEKLIFRNIEASKLKMNLLFTNKSILIHHLQLNNCDGKITASGSIKDLNTLNAKVNMNAMDAKKLFLQFENFGQEAVKSENLQGSLFLDANFSAQLDQNNEFKGESMKVDANVILKDGHLINFEPLQNISNFLFRKRDFNDVSFSEINETFKVRGFDIQIDELEIASSILNLYIVNGIYNLKGNSNINILIPWNNIKKRGRDYIPKNTGESAGNTKGLKLNYSGTPKNMKLSFGHKEQERRFW